MKILVVDDEKLARSELTYLIEQSPRLKDYQLEIFQSEDINHGLEILIKEQIDIIFLDISLNDENGFDLAQQLYKLPKAPLLIFATAFDEFAVKAFNVDAVDYILKPFEQKRVDQALGKAIRALGEKKAAAQKPLKNLLAIELDDRDVVIKKDNLISATVNNGILTITTKTNRYQTKNTLSWIKSRLTEANFVQVHRNSLVNLEAVKEVQPWFNHTTILVMNNNDKIHVGRSYQKDLKQRLEV
ncbi:Sensory transduction protein LytT [Bombilactobacillus mellis]|uniref:Sensory transduction protein LytT n=1 Tax=Bombilactobacillus mellis TaxID=1218508 RepID=A0A0F4L1P4_9LACO|nr:LytTR family transcriptional regulator DNA-binding domain-containing protein [Bombilactobacillus mellis]MBI0107082.1 LytTR family transcriptional regulator DNA-binding domain-containing protein [Lactobacillus sp. W8086]MBI0108546.1 LytTR family transcriptional regulator DNA-binding domain-containing protein [Lactobacillus sp. W8085]MBI0111764.1 LytTR family transcriptional regulator DNA-binding domain-containing protein [Lactobacillus sp. W8088]MBI0115479.1 LytTR family transcriptional regul